MDFAETWSKCFPKQVLQASVGLQKCIFWRQYCCSRAECNVLSRRMRGPVWFRGILGNTFKSRGITVMMTSVKIGTTLGSMSMTLTTVMLLVTVGSRGILGTNVWSRGKLGITVWSRSRHAQVQQQLRHRSVISRHGSGDNPWCSSSKLQQMCGGRTRQQRLRQAGQVVASHRDGIKEKLVLDTMFIGLHGLTSSRRSFNEIYNRIVYKG